MFWHSTTHLVRTLSGSMNLSRRAQCYATIGVWVRLMRADYGTRYISIYVPFHSWVEIMTTCSFRSFIRLSPSVVRPPSRALYILNSIGCSAVCIGCTPAQIPVDCPIYRNTSDLDFLNIIRVKLVKSYKEIIKPTLIILYLSELIMRSH